MNTYAQQPGAELELFWWVFAVRGGMALLFAGVLYFVAGLFGTLFFDPVVLVYLSLLLGFYIAGSGIVLGVAAGFAAEHHFQLWKNLAVDCVFTIGLGIYIGSSLLMSPHSLSLLAGFHALVIGAFQLATAWRLRRDRPSVLLLSLASVVSAMAAYFFLRQLEQDIRLTTSGLCYFETFCGVVALAFAWRLHDRTPLSHQPVLSEAPSL